MAPQPTPQGVAPGPNHTASSLCPACAHRGDALIVSTSNSSVGMMLLYLLFCLSCACCLLGDTRDRGLVYYCERCGLRLVTEDNEGSRVRYDDVTLMPKPSSTEKKLAGNAILGSKVARSPLGLPPPLNKPDLININARYRDLAPVQNFVVETGRFGLPTKVVDPTQMGALSYIIESPGIPAAEPGDKKETQYLQRRCAWNYGSGLTHQTTHFRVSSLSRDGFSQELAWIKLFGGANWDAEVHVASLEHTEESTKGRLGIRNSKKSYVKRQIFAAEESDWGTGGSGVLWASSEGVMLWSMRTVRDAEKVSARALCLLDAYDRLVVALRKTRRPEGNGKVWELRVYAEVSEAFMGEILASYTALRCQHQRILQEHYYDSS